MTHALAGLLMADATISSIERRTGAPITRSVRATAVVLGIVAAEFPDADLVYSGEVLGIGQLGYMLHHRGHTHTIVFALIIAFALWGIVQLVRRETRDPLIRTPLLWLALGGTLSHILLDFTNSYGVHPFWPFESSWYYGDAIFIIEPWLWVAAIPALLFGPRRLVGRVILSLALVGVLVLAWRVGMVPKDVAIVLTIGAALSLAAARLIAPRYRVLLATGLWLSFEAFGFAMSSAAERLVAQEVAARAPNATLVDVVLTSAAANPLCQNAIVIDVEQDQYSVHTATVAAMPGLRTAQQCNTGVREVLPTTGFGLTESMRAASADETSRAAVEWREEWIGSRSELRTLATTHCEFAAALQFMRVPVWRGTATGEIEMSDLRYGLFDNGFASVRFGEEPGECPGFVPGWGMPRGDVVGL